MRVALSTLDDTDRLAQSLAAVLPSCCVIGLVGTLGAGKTQFVRALAGAVGFTADAVTSPTYTLCHEYRGAKPIFHLDLYRIQDMDELLELGLEEYFQPDAWTLIEWSDRFPDALPPDHWRLEFLHAHDDSRVCLLQIPDPLAEQQVLTRLHATGLHVVTD